MLNGDTHTLNYDYTIIELINLDYLNRNRDSSVKVNVVDSVAENKCIYVGDSTRGVLIINEVNR